MKRYIILFFIALPLFSLAGDKLFYGLRGGVNMTVALQEINNQGFTIVGKYTGYHVGGTIHLEPTNFFGINSGIMFNTTGWIDKSGALADTLKYRKDVFNNIHIPLTLCIKVGIRDIVNVFIEGGAYANYAISGVTTFEDVYGMRHEQKVEFAKYNENASDSDYTYRRLQAGTVLGIGAQLDFLVVGFNYSFSLSDLTKNGIAFRNEVWSAYVGLRMFKDDE